MSKLGIFIAACIRSKEHADCLNRCINSILTFYDSEQIVVIIDFTSDINLIEKIEGIDYKHQVLEVPADMLLYFEFIKQNKFDKGIFLQDSMIIKEEFQDTDLIKDVKYLWHFTNHRVHWSEIKEPENEFNQDNNIIVHDDLLRYCFKHLIKNQVFQTYCESIYEPKTNWSGCFGCLTIMSKSFCEKLDEQTGIIDIMLHMKNNRLRRAIESIFSLACQFVIGNPIHDSYDGLYYDGISYHNQMNSQHICKVSFNRQ